MNWLLIFSFIVLFEFIRVAFVLVDLSGLLVWLVLLWGNSRYGFLLAFFLGMTVSFLGGDELGKISLLYLGWWFLLAIYKQKYQLDYLPFVIVATVLAAFSTAFIRTGKINLWDACVWIVGVLFVRWWNSKGSASSPIALKY